MALSTKLATKAIEIHSKFNKCREDEKNIHTCVLECAASTCNDIMQTKIMNHLLKERVTNYIMMIPKINKDINLCKQELKHHNISCIAGAVTNKIASITTDAMSTALIIGSPTTPIPTITLSAGIAGLMKSDQIGCSFGDLTIQIVDYLIDNITREELRAIDTTQSVTISNNQGSKLVFKPSEVKLITSLVDVNQRIRDTCTTAITKYEATEQNIKANLTELSSNIIRFEQQTRLIELDIHDIKTNGILDKLNTNYIRLNNQASEHNSRNTGTHASVEYSNTKGWKISFQVGYNANGKGGGFSCIIL